MPSSRCRRASRRRSRGGRPAARSRRSPRRPARPRSRAPRRTRSAASPRRRKGATASTIPLQKRMHASACWPRLVRASPRSSTGSSSGRGSRPTTSWLRFCSTAAVLGQGNEPGRARALRPGSARGRPRRGRLRRATRCRWRSERTCEACHISHSCHCAALSGDHGAARQALDVARDNGVDVTFAARAMGGQGSVPRCRRRPTCSIICFSSSARRARAPTSPPRQRRSYSSCSLMTTRRLRSFALPPQKRGRPSTSSTARPSLPFIPMLHLSCPNRRNRRALCGRSCSPHSRLDLGKDPRRVDRCAAGKQQGCEDRDSHGAGAGESKRRICARHAERKLRRDRRARRGPCRRRSNGLGPDRIRGRPVRSWQLLLVTTDPLSERARTALDSGVDIALKAGLPGPLLQRLVTALDALGEEVPIPLWDLAARRRSRTTDICPRPAFSRH